VEDFGAFCKAGSDAKTTLCTVTEARWVNTDDGWCFIITANRFLRNMVRAVVGTLIEVGRHRMTLDEFKDVVACGSRSAAGESVPAHGLFLWDVAYNEE
jgi:tRNA pseudouridine38-40 synthase